MKLGSYSAISWMMKLCFSGMKAVGLGSLSLVLMNKHLHSAPTKIPALVHWAAGRSQSRTRGFILIQWMTCCVIWSLPHNSSVPSSAPLSPDVTFRTILHCTGKTQASATTVLASRSSCRGLQRHLQPSVIRRSRPHRTESLKDTSLSREKKKKKVLGLQSHLLEKGINYSSTNWSSPYPQNKCKLLERQQ